MRVVSLNLDQGDARVVRRAIRQALDRCACTFSGQIACQDCQALAATLSELDRLVHRPAFGRTPLLTLVAANGRAHHDATLDDAVKDDFDDGERLRLLVRDEGIGGNC